MRAYARTPAERESSLVEFESHVEAFHQNGRISQALLGLSAQDRDLILLFAWADLSYEQLSLALEIPVGTVRSRLSRIRELLRDRLDPSAGASVEGRSGR